MLNFHQPQFLMGFFYAFLGTMLFSFKSIFIKLANVQGLDTNSVLMLRMAIALPIYMVIIVYLIKRQQQSQAVTRDYIGLIILNEPFSMNHVWGILLVMLGVLLLTLKSQSAATK